MVRAVILTTVNADARKAGQARVATRSASLIIMVKTAVRSADVVMVEVVITFQVNVTAHLVILVLCKSFLELEN